MKRFRCVLSLLLAMLVPAVGSCADAGPAGGQTESTDIASGTAPKWLDSLPEQDFCGETFHILCRTDKAYEFDAEEENGDNVTDAVYKRNRAVEERFHVDIQTVTADGGWDSRQTFMDLVTSSVLAGDNAYDLVMGYCAYITSLTLQDVLMNVKELPLIDFDRPWWYAGFNDNIEMGGKLFMCLGDASLTMWENLQVVYFNKKLMKDYKLASPYEKVEADTWTYDALTEDCKLFSADLDGNGTWNEEDQWGILFYNVRDYPIYFETPYCVKGKDGYPELTIWCDRFVDAYAKIFDFMSPLHCGRQFAPDADQKIFSEDRALFYQAPLRYAALFRDNTSDFGIVPFPKFDETQERYYTPVVDNLSVLCVPKTVKDPTLCGTMMEALCAESSRTVVPEYYEVALTRKYARDAESEAMLDLIRENVWFDIGFVYSQALNNLGGFIDIIKNDNPDIASCWASGKPGYESALKTLIEYFKGA